MAGGVEGGGRKFSNEYIKGSLRDCEAIGFDEKNDGVPIVERKWVGQGRGGPRFDWEDHSVSTRHQEKTTN